MNGVCSFPLQSDTGSVIFKHYKAVIIGAD